VLLHTDDAKSAPYGPHRNPTGLPRSATIKEKPSMWNKPTLSARKYCGIALSLLLSSALSLPAHAMENWKVNMAKSHFSSGVNTLVLERDTGSPNAPGKAAGGSFVVISGDKVYVAKDESAFDAASGKFKTVDYNRWRDMKIVQIGEKVRTNDYCSFHCQAGHPEPHRTLTFIAVGGDPSPRMRDIVVLNTP
jgi:hypothetical protein